MLRRTEQLKQGNAVGAPPEESLPWPLNFFSSLFVVPHIITTLKGGNGRKKKQKQKEHNCRIWIISVLTPGNYFADVCNFHNAHAVYARYGGIVFAAEEGEHIASALGDTNKGVILLNHGLLTVGSTVDEAGFMFGLLDRACAMQLAVEAAAANGIPKNVISDEEAAHNFKMASEANVLYREAQPDIEYEIEVAGGEDVVARGFESLRAVVAP